MNAATISRMTEASFQIAELLAGRVNFRSYLKPAPRLDLGETWDRAGLHQLIEEAKDDYHAAMDRAAGPGDHPHRLPYNLSTQGSWAGEAWGRHHPLHRSEWDPVAEAARAAGFVKAIPKFGMLSRLVERTTSCRGVNSPRTTLNLIKVAQRWSPGAAERFLRAVMRRSNQILPADWRVSWKALGMVLEEGPRCVGKAAVCAAAITLSGGERKTTYRSARAYLAGVLKSPRTFTEEVDGVPSWGPAEPVLEKAGYGVYAQTWEKTEPRRMVAGYLVLAPNGETYHAEAWGYSLRSGHWEPSSPGEKAREALKEAVAAFQRRRQAAKEAALPAGVTVLVTRADSLKAGNCLPGTDRFVADHRWEGRWYVPAEWLLETGNGLALNAAKVAVREVRAMM